MATAPTGNAMPCPERISVRFYPSAHLPTQTKPPEQVLPVPDAWYSVLLLPYRQTDAPTQTVQSDALRGMYIRQAKNDSRDSFIIAEVIRFGRFCETAVSAPELHALRELCRHRFWIVDSVSDLKRKVIALLDQVFPEYENLFTNTFGKTSLQLLSEYTTPEELLAVDTAKLAETIYTASRGHHGIEKAQEIQNTARQFLRDPLASDPIALLIRQYIGVIH